MPISRTITLLFLFLMIGQYVSAQSDKDSMPNTHILDSTKNNLKSYSKAEDSTSRKHHKPRVATIRSAIVPGWGQAYNREYWKIPIIYAALAIPTATFIYNNKYYNKTKYAYTALFNQEYGDTTNPAVARAYDTAVSHIDPQLKGLDLYSLQTYRNLFRQDRDYSILWFAILWGVNIVDATVFAHLKDFDVSDNLSMHLEPKFNSYNGSLGFSLALNIKKPTHQMSSILK